MQLQFLGATGTVTGSKYLLRHESATLLVDCGLLQGLKNLRLRNWAELPFDAASISAVVFTHAHLDHSGYLPLLVKSGFRGPVYCTPATAELCKILLPDSGHIQEEDAQYANRAGFSRHHPALPLYTQDDAARSLRQLRTVEFDQDFTIGPDLRGRFTPAGHILGAACLTVSGAAGKIVFSGDLGRPHDGIMNAPVDLDDVLLGELVWAATKSFMSGLAIMLVVWLLGLAKGFSSVLILPTVLLIGLAFAGLGLIINSLALGRLRWGSVVTPLMCKSGNFWRAVSTTS